MPSSRQIPILATLFLSACAQYPINAPLSSSNPDHPLSGYRFDNFPATDLDSSAPGNSDDLFIVVALSGGGARAAAFSYGLLEALRDTRIHWHGRDKSLLDEVDIITSVSGSSFTAAYYALHHEKTFDEFLPSFLYRNLQGELLAASANPLNWPRLASPTFDRVDLAAECYDRELFHGATYGDLLRTRRRPFLVLNATDISLGTRFEFTQEQFDFLHSDLASVSLGRAVAASSAFPIVLSPLSFHNYPKPPDFHEPAWISRALDHPLEPPGLPVSTTGGGALVPPGISQRLSRRAADLRSYENSAARPTIRLLDGAIADYMGLRGIIQSISSEEGDWSIRRLERQGRIKKLVVISLNAVRTPPLDWDRDFWSPNLFEVLYVTASAPIRNNAFDTVTVFEDQLRENSAAFHAPAGATSGVDSFFIPLDFGGIADPALRDRLEHTETALSLPRNKVDDLRLAARMLLQNSPEFKRLQDELNY